MLRLRDTNGDGMLDEKLYFTNDAAMHITSIVNTAGVVLERYSYDPYGKRSVWNAAMTATTAASAYAVEDGFTGRLLDSESGLWYFRNRYFDSSLGRFTQRDPAGYVDGLSLYRGYFVPGGVDPSGLNPPDETPGSTPEPPNPTPRIRPDQQPRDLSEQLAVEEAKGKGSPISDFDKKQVDKNFPPEKFEKMAYKRTNSDGSVTEVHYWRNKETGEESGHKVGSRGSASTPQTETRGPQPKTVAEMTEDEKRRHDEQIKQAEAKKGTETTQKVGQPKAASPVAAAGEAAAKTTTAKEVTEKAAESAPARKIAGKILGKVDIVGNLVDSYIEGQKGQSEVDDWLRICVESCVHFATPQTMESCLEKCRSDHKKNTICNAILTPLRYIGLW